MWLEISNRGNGKIDVIPPAGYHGIPGQPGMVMVLEKREECLPHPPEIVFFAHGLSQEGVGGAGGVATGILITVLCPVVTGTFCAVFPDKALLFEEVHLKTVTQFHDTASFPIWGLPL